MHAITTSKTELELGATLGAMIQNTETRARLVENSTEVLAQIGAQSDLTLLADTADLVHLVIPAEIDAARVAAGDESYFEELGKAALGSCMYEEMPD
ncbi:hypothetical protein [Roseibium sp. Sym1]|uniref:hypothetical protein n=1 Tax=Roseibium sp. Sym1 TaxID=3016006 RepID=UPI0022B55350|nr:hypothetical protein [Roseibium sp. Sym1]